MNIDLRKGDCLEHIKKIPNGSINLICTDLPYFKVVENEWDNKWKDNDDYLNWIESIIIELKRIITQDGSIFLFTSR